MEYENSMVQTGYVTFLKKVSEKSVSISLGVGSKIKDNEYKTGFLNARGSTEVLKDIEKGDKVKVKGFLSFNFWTPEGSDKEMQRPVMVITEVLDSEKGEPKEEGEKKKTTAKKTTAKKTTTKKEEKEEKLPEIDVDEEVSTNEVKEENIPEVEVDEDEIPF